jgi:hypothetical protein
MRQNLLDDSRIFNAGDDLDLPRAPLAGLDIDVKYPLQTLHPGHRLVALGGRLVQPIFPGRLTPLASPLRESPARLCGRSMTKNRCNDGGIVGVCNLLFYQEKACSKEKPQARSPQMTRQECQAI